MRHLLLILPVLLPMAAGVTLLCRRQMGHRRFTLAAVGVTSALAVLVLFTLHGKGAAVFVRLAPGLELALRVDSLSLVFGLLVSLLWPVSTVYALSYMTHEGHERSFFSFFLLTYGAVLGLTLSANFLTLYLFYEVLTLCTLPLVMHGRDGKARYAGRRYLIYSFAGAALGLASLELLYHAGGTLEFVYGGVLGGALPAGEETVMQIAFLLGFCGFGVKAALFPFHGWLPAASVAPTPVTALLHAVAVVKAGVFAVARLIYFGFGAGALVGTWSQNVALGLAAFTIVFGSAMALREKHLKRRLAYSTISNLSYILFSLALMTTEGLTGGLTHLLCHAIIKILLFFCAGAVLCQSGREYVNQMRGIGRVMPVTMSAFVFGALSLAGLPPLPGFLGKWNIAAAAVHLSTPMAYVGIGALLLSVLFTWLYLWPVVLSAFFPREDVGPTRFDGVRDPGRSMTGPLVLLSIVTILFVVCFPPLHQALALVSQGY